ncbi:MAG TPA: sulfur carrier protein ThiS [Bacteroidales bacterium]|jgi:thiamine biosynthesis protein ThiS|nr:sulfur carrier protein ThiS [Bacteroidales bacterium]
MKILLNNIPEIFPEENLSVSELLIRKKFTFKLRIVKINGRLISKDRYDSTIISDGDDVQMLYLMSGG